MESRASVPVIIAYQNNSLGILYWSYFYNIGVFKEGRRKHRDIVKNCKQRIITLLNLESMLFLRIWVEYPPPPIAVGGRAAACVVAAAAAERP